MKRALLCLTLLLLAVGVLGQTTAVPPLMNFQGRLSKPDGTPLPDGTYSVLFSFYDAATSGTLQWSETKSVAVHNGTFAALLGSVTALNDPVFAGNRWLELKVGTSPALAPRQQIVSAAYAFKADTVPDGSITLTKLANGALNFTNISGTVAASQYAMGTIPVTALAGNPFAALGKFSVGPSLLSSVATGASPYSVAALNGVACVAPQGTFSLQVFNVSNPAAPTLTGVVALAVQPTSVAMAGHYAYVVGSFIIPQNPPTPPLVITLMYIIDVSNPAAPTIAGAAQLYAISTFAGLPFDSIAVSGSTACITDPILSAMFTVNISAPASPAVVGSVTTDSGPRGIAVSGANAYVVNDTANTLQIFNVSNPAAPTLTSRTTTVSTPVGVAVSGSFAYVAANGANTLQTFNVSNPANPSLSGLVVTGANPNAVVVAGTNAYVVSGGTNTLQTFSLSVPGGPALTQTTATGSGPIGLAIAGSTAYVTDLYSNELQIFDLNGTTIGALQVSGNLSVESLYGIDDLVRVFGGLEIDENSEGSGTLTDGLRFGRNSGEGIASNRQGNGANPDGLDFYTANIKRMSISNGGAVTASGSLTASGGSSAGVTGVSNSSGVPGVGGVVGTDTSAGGTGLIGNGGATGIYANGASFGGYFVGGDGVYGLNGAGSGITPLFGYGYGVRGDSDNGHGVVGTSGTGFGVIASANSGYGLYASSVSGTAGYFQGAVTIAGIATVHKVQIVGGSDVAEPYTIAAAGGMAPIAGYVVAIDTARIGQMRVADKAYDTTVSGIISGANGVEPGITLTQKGTVADGSLPVASMGRVWCWCDAGAGGAIAAGDLLTTSATPGHAMKAGDASRERGAILGKAMSPLATGRGLVLVLVTLQ